MGKAGSLLLVVDFAEWTGKKSLKSPDVMILFMTVFPEILSPGLSVCFLSVKEKNIESEPARLLHFYALKTSWSHL